MGKQRTPINNKLTIREVKKIKRLRFKTKARVLAEEYDVHVQTIYKIWNQDNWAWL